MNTILPLRQAALYISPAGKKVAMSIVDALNLSVRLQQLPILSVYLDYAVLCTVLGAYDCDRILTSTLCAPGIAVYKV